VTLPVERRATLDDFLEQAARGRAVELINGEVLEKAAPSPGHGATQFQLAGGLAAFGRKPGGPRGPGGWWLMTETEVAYGTGDVFRHDALGFRRDAHAERPTGFPLRARPDWVCEILSPSTARIDLVLKQRVLHHEGVPHYWILDPEHATLVVYRHGPDGYVNVLSAGIGDVVRAEPFEAVELDVGDLFGEER
jgi:Uma2 family endonuclease